MTQSKGVRKSGDDTIHLLSTIMYMEGLDTDLPSAPVVLRVVFYKPHMPKDAGRLANTSEMWMTFILDYKIDDFSNVAGFVKGSIHIIDRDGSRATLGA